MVKQSHEAVDRLVVRELEVRARQRSILRSISLTVAPGEILAVIGPNGSGKTTLLEAIAGLRAMHAGTVQIGARELKTFHERALYMAYMPDDVQLPPEATLGTALGLHRADRRIERFGLTRLLAARASEVSRGEAKRAELCATLLLGRQVLLLDEAFAAFDPRQLRALLPLVRELVPHAAVIVTVHQMETAALIADTLLLLSEGRALAFGTLSELRLRAELPDASLEQVFLRLLEREHSHDHA